MAGHFVFYPVIEGFRNRRLQRLARPAVGVLVNTPAFAYALSQVVDDTKIVIMATMIYIYTFVWNGAGVVIGYIVGDIINGDGEEQWM